MARMIAIARPRRGLSLVAALALSWSSLAFAAPAVIKRRTEARSAPFAVAPQVDDLSAGTKLSADETASNGWRRVQLPSGKFAFVHDEDIEVDLSHPTPPPAPVAAAPAAPAPDATAAPIETTAAVEPILTPRAGHVPQYVVGLGQLSEI